MATPSGGSGITLSAGGGAGGPGAGIGGSVGPVISNGRTLQDQGGPFTYAGGSVGDGLESGGANVSWGHNSHGRTIVDGNPAWTPTLGDGLVNVHLGETNTWTFRSYAAP